MATPAQTTASEHLGRISPAMRRIVQAARRTVKAVAPMATELPYRSSGSRAATSRAMYKMFRYLLDDEQVAGLGAFPASASLFFRRGSELDDAGGLLEGSGRARFIRLTSPADAERPAVKRIVRQAFALGATAPSSRSRSPAPRR
jgi:hypothetical protein